MKLTAALLATLLSVAASASIPLAPAHAPKTYAVFLATYDPATGETVGGVAGSAFFVSPTKAITAFHVLQPKSFTNSRTQIWLVHENEPAIELSRSELSADPSLDRTTITLLSARAPARHIFSTHSAQVTSEAQSLATGTKVETDGFLADSTGPVLELHNTKLTISNVPHLERLHSEGTVLRQVRIELASNDVNLKNAPCVQVSYQPVVGLSGGPVFSGDRVIGMNSFADPEARKSTWAIDLSKD